MFILEPTKFMSMSDERFLHEGFLHLQKDKMQFTLANIGAIPTQQTISSAAQYIVGTTEINITDTQLLAILSLYPYCRCKLAVYHWGSTEMTELISDVIANFFLSTRWPSIEDQVDIKLFVERLRQSALFMGYKLAN